MNAAAKALAQYYYFDRPLRIFFHAPWRLACVALLICVTFSAVSLVYTRGLSREYTTSLLKLQQEEQQLHAENKQLLLERGAWANPVRLQLLAEERLSMILPDDRSFKTV